MALPTGGYLLDIAKRALAAHEERKKAENEARLQRAQEEYDRHFDSFDDEGNRMPQVYATPDPVSKAGTRAKWSALGAPQAGAIAAAGGPQPFDPLRFAAEETAIGASIKGAGLGLKAAGGLVGKAPKSPVTETPAFKKWFRSSKAVDDSGSPVVAYHGTTSDFDEFSPYRVGSATDSGWLGEGFYFTSEPDIANYYAHAGAKGSRIIPAHLSLQSPLKITTSGHNLDKKTAVAKRLGLPESATASELTQALKDAGHDGVMYVEKFSNGNRTEYLVLEPNQIKSSIGNRGTYSLDDPRISYSIGAGAIGAGAASRSARDDDKEPEMK